MSFFSWELFFLHNLLFFIWIMWFCSKIIVALPVCPVRLIGFKESLSVHSSKHCPNGQSICSLDFAESIKSFLTIVTQMCCVHGSALFLNFMSGFLSGSWCPESVSTPSLIISPGPKSQSPPLPPVSAVPLHGCILMSAYLSSSSSFSLWR